MMRNTIKITCFILSLTLLGTLSASPLWAADCKALRQTVKKERNLIKRRNLLAEATQQCPDDAVMNFMYGYSLERLRKYDAALKYYIIASGLDKKYAKPFFGMADIYMIMGDVTSAVAAYEKGMSLDPKNKRAKKSLNLARIKLKAQTGGTISSDDFVTVMQEKKSKAAALGSVEGPILRMLIIFPGDSTELSEQATDQLSLVVGRALQSPALKDAVFEVAGHTDDNGSAEVNLAVSKKRAESVKRYLVENFNIAPKRLQVAYYGHTRPAAPNTTAQNRQMNRRVEFKRLK